MFEQRFNSPTYLFLKFASFRIQMEMQDAIPKTFMKELLCQQTTGIY